MSQRRNVRFDDIQRTERYYTATLFPAFLLHDNWAGLRTFLDALRSRSAGARDGNGRRLETTPRIVDPNTESVELITEFHIARDLNVAGFSPVWAQSSAQATPDSTTPEVPVRQDVPDVVIVLDDQLVVCEAKFFGTFTTATLNRQFKSQREQIKLLFHARPGLKAYWHVALLPIQLSAGSLDCDALFTWREIADLADNCLKSAHYVSQRLRAGEAYYQNLTGPVEGGSGVQGQVSLADALDRCRTATPTSPVWIGFAGGKQALTKRPIAELRARPWKWRTSLDGAVRANWLKDQEFLSLMQALQAGQETAAAQARWDDGLSLVEVVDACASTTHACYVGYSDGRDAFRQATLQELEKRHRWKVHDPERHRQMKIGKTWIPGDGFLKRINELRGQR